MSDLSTLTELIRSLHNLKGLQVSEIIDNKEYSEFRESMLGVMKIVIDRMKEVPVEDEMVKSIRERLDAQFKEDDKLYGKTPKLYRKDKD